MRSVEKSNTLSLLSKNCTRHPAGDRDSKAVCIVHRVFNALPCKHARCPQLQTLGTQRYSLILFPWYGESSPKRSCSRTLSPPASPAPAGCPSNDLPASSGAVRVAVNPWPLDSPGQRDIFMSCMPASPVVGLFIRRSAKKNPINRHADGVPLL